MGRGGGWMEVHLVSTKCLMCRKGPRSGVATKQNTSPFIFSICHVYKNALI